jgi:hypothetical protein
VTQGDVDGPPELAPDGQDGVAPEVGADPLGGAVARAGVDDEEVVDGVGLPAETAQRLADERTTVVTHDDGDDAPTRPARERIRPAGGGQSVLGLRGGRSILDGPRVRCTRGRGARLLGGGGV